MSVENSSIVFGVRTEEAVAGLGRLRKEILGTLEMFQALDSKVKGMKIGPTAEAVGAMKTAKAEMEALANSSRRMGKTLEEVDDTSSRVSVGIRKRFGDMSASIKLGVGTLEKDLQATLGSLEASANKKGTALNSAMAQERLRIAEATNQNMAQLARKFYAQQENAYQRALASQMSGEAARARAIQESAARTEATERNMAQLVRRFQAQRQADYNKALASQMSGEAARARAIQESAARTEAVERNMAQLARRFQAERLEDYNKALASQMSGEAAKFQAFQKLEAEATARHAATRKRQLDLAIRYDEMEVASRIRTLNKIAALQGTGKYSSSQLMRRYGRTAMEDLPNLANYTAQQESLRLEAKLRNEREKGINPLANMTKELNKQTGALRESHSAVRGLAGSLGQMWMTWGSLVPLMAGAGVGIIARQTFSVGKDVEFRLKMLEALGNAATSVDAMMPAVHGSMKTPLEAAQGLQELAQAGLKTNEALAVLPTTLRLATLGEMSVADAALTTTSALSTFNLQMHEAARVGDVFAKAASISNTTVAGLAEAMKQAGSAASTYGLTVEDMSAQIAVLAQHGIRGSAAGTAIKNSMAEIYAPTKKAAAAMAEIGLKIYDQDHQARNYIDILTDLKTAYVGLNDEGRNALLKGMFNERSRRAIQILLQGLDELKDMTGELGDSFGYLAKANNDLLNTVEGASNRMQSVLQQTLVRSFDDLKPEIRQVVEELEAMFASDGFKQGVQTIGRAFANLTMLLTSHGDVLLKTIAIYSAYRVLLAGARSATALLATATGALTATKALDTAATQTNTAAQTANNIAKTGALATSARWIAGLARFTPGVGLLTTAVLAGASAWSAWNAAAGNSELSASRQQTNLQKITESIRTQTEALWENLRARNLQSSVGDWSMAGEVDKDRKALEEAMRRRNELLESPYSKHRPSDLAIAVDSIMPWKNSSMEGYKKWRSEMDATNEAITRLNQSLQDAPDALAKFEEAQNLTRKGAEKDTAMGRVQAILGDIGYIAEDRKPAFEGMRVAAQGLLDQLNSASEVTDAVKVKIAELEKNFSSARSGYTPAGDDKGGSLIFRSSSANILQELANQKRLLETERDFRLGLIKKEQDEGVLATKVATDRRTALWEEYTEKYAALAERAAGRIRALDKGSDDLKGLSVAKVNEMIAQEKRLAEQSIRLQQEREKAELESQARIIAGKVDSDLKSTDRTLAEDERLRQIAVLRSNMYQHEVAMLEARNKVGDRYNAILEKQRQLLDKGRLSNPDFDNTEAGQMLLNAIARVEAEKSVRSAMASSRALQDYESNQSILEGYKRALAELGDQALTVGDTVQNALTTSFSAVGSAVGNIVATGQFSLRSFIADLTAQISQMFANRWVAQFLMAMLPTFGGGATLTNPTTTAVPTVTGGTNFVTVGAVNALGNAFSHGEVVPFAKGAAFTNSVVNRPSLAPMALFGEAGPEAIMPLTRTAGGELGVRAVPYGADFSSSGGSVGGVAVYVDITVNGGTGEVESSNVRSSAAGLGQIIGDEVRRVLVKESGQGGMLRRIIKENA